MTRLVPAMFAVGVPPGFEQASCFGGSPRCSQSRRTLHELDLLNMQIRRELLRCLDSQGFQGFYKCVYLPNMLRTREGCGCAFFTS